ncbi:NAD-dependent epimerase/dehydratase family protein [Microtetraspora fusca]|uniref:NAD-dependent epimerase/dehydratase family protein n=1 Tax=Microtetraspora fusca TaxID=1997 RepID=A0ABW6V565_MICFU
MTGPERHDWEGTRVLVTGATGFLGSRLALRLDSLGAEVHATSRRPPANDEAGDSGIVWHTADLRDPDEIRRVIHDVRPAVVFHLASEVTGSRDMAALLPTLHNTVPSAVNVLTAATGVPGVRVVVAGSVEEARPELGETLTSSPYAVAKWAATGYARLFHQLWGLSVTVLRVAMVYGPGQPDTTKVVPYVTVGLLAGEEPALTAGRRRMDWVYVDDVAEAFVLAARSERAVGRVFDIGSGTGVAVRDVVERLFAIVGRETPPRFGARPDRVMDVERIADVAEAAEIIGWRATTPLDEGLRRTVEWYASRR